MPMENVNEINQSDVYDKGCIIVADDQMINI